jgi:lipopolysaccharide transport system ATP-binding protein
MTNEIAIQVENLGKRYRYGGIAPLSDSLRTDITDWAKGLLRIRGEKRPPGTPHHETFRQVHAHRLDIDPNYFWALHDVNLEIKQGEVVAIIGRNGSGKSTLLKILSRITPPTTGMITYHGRVASLLEVGTGFHRELTGRENVFLNGSILGMKRAEITRRFDEIVAFAEVDKFIDTPVKFYSSGMYVRLAFAVAAHLQPEILIVDEVLAVGDAAFQNKCLGKMDEVAKQGRTVLLVSHNLSVVTQLANRGLLLQEGNVLFYGDARQAVKAYEDGVTHGQSSDKNSRSLIQEVTMRQSGATVSAPIASQVGFEIAINYSLPPEDACMIGIAVVGVNRRRAFTCLSHWSVDPTLMPRDGTVTVVIPPLNLAAGRYHLVVALKDPGDRTTYSRLDPALFFEVAPDPDIPLKHALYGEDGILSVRGKWKFEAQ